MTAGSHATAMAAAPDAREWLRGGIVTYQTAMKRLVLGVTAEDVVTAECARLIRPVAPSVECTTADRRRANPPRTTAGITISTTAGITAGTPDSTT